MLNKYTVLIISLLLLGVANLHFYKNWDSKISIDKSAILLSRMESSSNDSLNLNFDKIAHLIKDKRIVILGEKIHKGGTTLKFKTELTKYLHSKHGFKTIIFEAGLYDTYKIKSDTAKLKEALWAFWYNSNEMVGLWKHTGTNKDIEIAGFDVQMSGYRDYKQRGKGIDSILLANNIKMPHIIDSIKNKLPMLVYSGRNMPKQKQDSIIAELKNISVKLNEKNKLIDAKYFSNIAEWYNCVWKYDWGSSKRFHIRDSLMADNLQFQIENFYNDKKVIIWVSNMHSLNSNEYTEEDENNFTPMGERVKERYGDEVFTLCTTSYGSANKHGSFYDKGSNRTLEYQLYRDGYKYAFVDLASLKDKSFRARINQGYEYSAKWAKMTDAIFYIDIEKQITYK